MIEVYKMLTNLYVTIVWGRSLKFNKLRARLELRRHVFPIGQCHYEIIYLIVDINR